MHSFSLEGAPSWLQINCVQNWTETKCAWRWSDHHLHPHQEHHPQNHPYHYRPPIQSCMSNRVYLATDWQRQKRQSSVAGFQNPAQNWPPAPSGQTAVLGPNSDSGTWQNSRLGRLASKSALTDVCFFWTQILDSSAKLNVQCCAEHIMTMTVLFKLINT